MLEHHNTFKKKYENNYKFHQVFREYLSIIVDTTTYILTNNNNKSINYNKKKFKLRVKYQI